jgi:hypothetical protein
MLTLHVADTSLSGGKSPPPVIASFVCNCELDELRALAGSGHLDALLAFTKYSDGQSLLGLDVPTELDLEIRPSSPTEIAEWVKRGDADLADGGTKVDAPRGIVIVHASDEMSKLRSARDLRTYQGPGRA